MSNFFDQIDQIFTFDIIWSFSLDIIKTILVVVASIFIIKIGQKVIEFTINNAGKIRISKTLSYRNVEQKNKTIIRLLENVMKYTISTLAFFIILGIFIDAKTLASLVTGAGVLGVVLGLGAQSLIKDVIAGFFIIFEDQMLVGDYVVINGFEGTVEEVGLKTTRLKNASGLYHIIPNGSIIEITNYSIGENVVYLDVSISSNEDVEKVIAILKDLMTEIPSKISYVKKVPKVLGVQQILPYEVKIRISTEVDADFRWTLERELRKEVKVRFDEIGIQQPRPLNIATQH